jgi:hypothetical protein
MIFAGFEFVGRSIDDNRTGSFAENAYLMQIETCENIVFENNVIHDSYENDVVKLNNYAKNCTFRGNIMYNPQPRGGHQIMDINNTFDTIIEDNIFFIDYVSSGRTEPGTAKRENDPDRYGDEKTQGNPSGFLMIKSSVGRMQIENGTYTVEEASEMVTNRVTISRNIFYNYVGQADYSFIGLGEDGQSFDEVKNVLIENNLFLMNEVKNKTTKRTETELDEAKYYTRSAGMITIKSASNVMIRANTATGWTQYGGHGTNTNDWQAGGFFVKIGHEQFPYDTVNGEIPYTWQSNDHITIENNIVEADLLQNSVDWTGTHKTYNIMGILVGGRPEWLEDSIVNNNCYWDDGYANTWVDGKGLNKDLGKFLYDGENNALTYSMDENKIVAKSLINMKHKKDDITLVYLSNGKINGKFKTIEKARLSLAEQFTKPQDKSSPVIDRATNNMPTRDIMYNKRSKKTPDIGAFEF